MSRWKRDEAADAIALAADVPDGLAVSNQLGNLIAWDESNAHAYVRRVGIQGMCDDACAGVHHVIRV